MQGKNFRWNRIYFTPTPHLYLEDFVQERKHDVQMESKITSPVSQDPIPTCEAKVSEKVSTRSGRLGKKYICFNNIIFHGVMLQMKCQTSNTYFFKEDKMLCNNTCMLFNVMTICNEIGLCT